MACYWGCSSISNKIAYSLAAVFFAVGAALLVAWYVTSDACISAAEDCARSQGLEPDRLFNGLDLASVRNLTSASDPAAAFCSAVLPSEVVACEYCYNEGAGCFEPTFYTFVAGIVFWAITILLLPCWCLFCASSPHDD
eukprot:jgi/Tetstr1/424340/TSEL_014905.t1